MAQLIDNSTKKVQEAFDRFNNEAQKMDSLYEITINALNGQDLKDEAILNYNNLYLISLWVLFEQYAKDVAQALFQCESEELLNPEPHIINIDKYSKEKINNRSKKMQNIQINFSDLYLQTDRFTNIKNLKVYAFQQIANEAAKGNNDVSEYISLIRYFLNNNKNPYEFDYSFNDSNKHCDYYTINAIRTMRNSLIHHGGLLSDRDKEDIEKFIRIESDKISLDSVLFAEIKTIMKSTANNLYDQVNKHLQEKRKTEEFKNLQDELKFWEQGISNTKQTIQELKKELEMMIAIYEAVNIEYDEWLYANCGSSLEPPIPPNDF